jgi:hypothetical protein
MLAIWMFSTAFTGYAAGRIGLASRAARLVLGFGILVPWLWIEVASLALIAI